MRSLRLPYLESCPRSAPEEKVFFGGYLAGHPIKGLLYGIENQEIFYICDCLKTKKELIKGHTPPKYQSNFLFELYFYQYQGLVWKNLKKSDVSKNLRTQISIIDACLSQKTFAEANAALKQQSFYHDQAVWISLFKQLLLVSLKNCSLPENLIKQISTYCDNPYSEDFLYAPSMDELIELRDQESVKHISSLVRQWGKEVEVILFSGFLHMKGLIKGLQEAQLA